MGHISDIKLIKTDTTLDLSQKAEKGMLLPLYPFSFYKPAFTSSCTYVFNVGLQKTNMCEAAHLWARVFMSIYTAFSWHLDSLIRSNGVYKQSL